MSRNYMKLNLFVMLQLLLLNLVANAQTTQIDSVRSRSYNFDRDSLGNYFQYVKTERVEAFKDGECRQYERRYEADSILSSYQYEFISSQQNKRIFISWDRSSDYREATFEYEEFESTTNTYKRLELLWEQYPAYKVNEEENGFAKNIQWRNHRLDSGVPDQVYLNYDTTRLKTMIAALQVIEFDEGPHKIAIYETFDFNFQDFFDEIDGKASYEDRLLFQLFKRMELVLMNNAIAFENHEIIELKDKLRSFEARPSSLFALSDKKRPYYLKRGNKQTYCLEKGKDYERWGYGLKKDEFPEVTYEVFR